MSVSVLILTLNEETNLRGCLESVAWSDDIVVFDSYSTDRTVNIAKEFGARIIRREFDNWSSHQNWAVQNIKFKYPWVYHTDADERCDDELRNELTELSEMENGFSAFQVRRKNFLMGKWLKHAQLYPTWITRVFRPEKIRYERLVNPVAILDGEVGQLEGHIIHYPFSHGIAHWYARHNNYSDMEAQELVKEILESSDYKGIFCKNAARRRKAIKQIAYRMPCRPLLMWLYLMLVRRAFLDGMPGLTYCRLRAIYEYMIDLKVRELRRHKKGLPI